MRTIPCPICASNVDLTTSACPSCAIPNPAIQYLRQLIAGKNRIPAIKELRFFIPFIGLAEAKAIVERLEFCPTEFPSNFQQLEEYATRFTAQWNIAQEAKQPNVVWDGKQLLEPSFGAPVRDSTPDKSAAHTEALESKLRAVESRLHATEEQLTKPKVMGCGSQILLLCVTTFCSSVIFLANGAASEPNLLIKVVFSGWIAAALIGLTINKLRTGRFDD